MHEHDTDLIMALSEGALSADAAAAAETEIASCAECLEDLRLQRVALTAIRATESPRLTSDERDRLHGALKHQLGLEAEEAPRSAPAQRRWWRAIGGLATAASVLIALVLIAPTLDFLSPGGNDESGDLLASELSSTTVATDAAVDERGAGIQGTAANESDQPTFTDGSESPDATRLPVTSTTLDAVPPSGETYLPLIATTDEDEASTLDELLSIASASWPDLQLINRRVTARSTGVEQIEPEVVDACAAGVTGSGDVVDAVPVAWLESGSVAGVVIVYVTSNVADSFVVLHSTDDCARLDTIAP